jgi:hypothetical protein
MDQTKTTRASNILAKSFLQIEDPPDEDDDIHAVPTSADLSECLHSSSPTCSTLCLCLFYLSLVAGKSENIEDVFDPVIAERIREIFLSCDVNHDGVISYSGDSDLHLSLLIFDRVPVGDG